MPEERVSFDCVACSFLQPSGLTEQKLVGRCNLVVR